VIELCNSAAKVVKNPVSTKCFGENFEVPIKYFSGDRSYEPEGLLKE
jgi:hypothetical protein